MLRPLFHWNPQFMFCCDAIVRKRSRDFTTNGMTDVSHSVLELSCVKSTATSILKGSSQPRGMHTAAHVIHFTSAAPNGEFCLLLPLYLHVYIYCFFNMYIDACPNGQVLCSTIADPCQTSTCPTFPSAICEADYCAGCMARWYYFGLEVTKFCHSPSMYISFTQISYVLMVILKVNSNATDAVRCPVEGQLHTRCGSQCPPTCDDPNPFCHLYCVRACQCIQGTVWDEANGRRIPLEYCCEFVA